MKTALPIIPRSSCEIECGIIYTTSPVRVYDSLIVCLNTKVESNRLINMFDY